MHMKKIISTVLAAMLLLTVFAMPSIAADRLVEVRIDGERLNFSPTTRLIGDTTYVPIYKFCTMMGVTEKSFDDATKTATIKCRGIEIVAQKGEKYVILNGRYIYTGLENVIIDSTMFVPVRPLAKAFGAEVIWHAEDYSVDVYDNGEMIESGEKFYNADDLLWLARIIYAESNTEPLEGKIAVGNVVLNRVASGEFPNNIHDVIFDKKYGTQFTPVDNGTIYNDPNEECIMAAKICLEGYTLSNEIIYFIDAVHASNMWVVNNREFAFKINNHDFYR